MIRLALFCLAVSLGVAVAAPAAKAKPDTSKLPPIAQNSGVTYATHVQKIFEASCVKCHGAEKAKGDLRLDSREAVLKGSEHGKVIVPGKSAESLLVHAVAQIGDEDNFMPPPGNKAGIKKLTAEEVSLIRAWIEQGAK